MRKLPVILFLAVYSFVVKGQSEVQPLQKPVSLNLTEKSVEEALNLLQDQFNLSFFYNSNLSCLNNKVDIYAKDEAVSHVLSKLFSCSTVKFEVVNDKILIIEKELSSHRAETPLYLDTVSEKTEVSDSANAYLKSNKWSLGNIFRILKEPKTPFFPRYTTDTIFKIRDSIVVDTIIKSSIYRKRNLRSKAYRNHLLNTQREKLSVGFYMTPGFSFRSLKSTNKESEKVVSTRNKYENKSFSYTTGLVLRYLFSDNIAFTTGFAYLKVGERGNIENQAQKTYSNRYGFLYLPIGISIEKRGPETGVGLLTELAIGTMIYKDVNLPDYNTGPSLSSGKVSDHRDNYDQDNYYWYSNDSQNSYYDWNNSDDNNWHSNSNEAEEESDNSSPSSGSGDNTENKNTTANYKNQLRSHVIILSLQPTLDYKINSKITFFLAPDIKLFLSSIYTSKSAFNQKPYSIGMIFGLRGRLR